MDNKAEIIELAQSLEQEVLRNEPLCGHTTFKIGGPCDALIEINDTAALCVLIKAANELDVKYMVIGNGSNLLFDDLGYDGLIFHIGSGLSDIKVIDNGKIRAEAGAMLISVCKAARDVSLSGLEFAYGIPGSVGGAVYMNAGAYGGEIKDVLEYCEVVDKNGDIKNIPADELELSYRSSLLQSTGETVVTAVFKMKRKRDRNMIDADMKEYMSRRKEKQPLEYPSAGSTFRRPAGCFAGKLIEDSGLRGFSIGDAQVSDKHCGFVINRGKATFKDVTELIEYVQKKVLADSGKDLKCEVLIKRYGE